MLGVARMVVPLFAAPTINKFGDDIGENLYSAHKHLLKNLDLVLEH